MKRLQSSVAMLDGFRGDLEISITLEDARKHVADRATLVAAMIYLLENVEEPPDRNCSCHISTPCNDCVVYDGLREALKEARAALKLAKD